MTKENIQERFRLLLPFPPPWIIEGVEWSFWSFHLTGQSSTSVGNASLFFAEVIFAHPTILIARPGSGPIPMPLAPAQSVATPLDNSNIVGVSAGLSGVFDCNGADFQLLDSAGLQSTPVNTFLSGSTTVTVNNGIATLTDMNLVFSKNVANSPALFALYGPKSSIGQLIYHPSYGCAGTWKFKQSWAAFGPLAGLGQPPQYSLANPPLPVPAFPPGGEFSK
ncbi:MAG: hypothetical protein ABSB66_09660 [Candidatus Acidiferrales bacterium]|jgi:hypothetical protein